MIIRLASDYDKDIWDEFVQGHSYASSYHLFAWKMAVEKAYGHKAYYFIAEENNKVSGVLPLIYLKPPLFHGQFVSLPFCDIGDVLARDENTKKNLILKAVSLARNLKTKYIELRGQHHESSFQYLDLPVNILSHKVRMLLELPQSSEILWSNFKSKLRSQIRKAEKNGLRFIWGHKENIDSFYKIFCRNMRDLGSPVHSKKWFRTIFHYYRENARMGLVYYERQPVGAGIILSISDKISISWASTLKDYNLLSPNMLLYWNLLKYAADNGYAHFDFGRSTLDEGTYKFKAQWGAKPVPLCWNYILTSNEQLSFDKAISTKRKKIGQLWQKLPLVMANSIGPVIRKHISL